MDLKESAAQGEFRAKVRAWIEANLPGNLRRQDHVYHGMDEDDSIDEWFRRLAVQGWLAYRWPKENGGPGFSAAEQIVFADECRRFGAPVPRGFGISMIGPALIRFGSDWQKERFLPKIARHEEMWCQGYSEPNAGSDLAGLQTRAELAPDREHFIVNGQKVWTSRAAAAGWIFALVRTDPDAPKQKWISFMLIDMKTPGVTIRPIRQTDDQQGFFETFFDNVRVPVQNVVGEVNQGWTVAKALLEHERFTTGTNFDGHLERLKRVASDYLRNGEPMLADGSFREKLTHMEMDADCLRFTRYRSETALMQGRQLGPEASIFKLYDSELFQRVCDLALEAMGPDAMAWYDRRLSQDGFDWPMRMTITRATSIYSGSNEIQRNIIAKRVLDLPD